MNWQPIETAPRDGTEILAWRKDCGTIIIRWDSAESFMTDSEIDKAGLTDDELFGKDWFCADFIQGCRLEGSEVPTHWQPLPDPPSE